MQNIITGQYHGLATLSRARGEHREALLFYDKALKEYEVPKKDKSDIYLYMAGAILFLGPLNEQNRKLAVSFIDKAIKLNPNDQSAKLTAAEYYTFIKDYAKAISYLAEVKDPDVISTKQASILDETIKELRAESLSDPMSFLEHSEKLEVIYRNLRKSPTVAQILITIYTSGQEFMKAFVLMEDVLDNFRDNPKIVMGCCVNFSLYFEKYPTEGIKIAKKGLELYQQQTESFKRENIKIRHLLETNLALNFIRNDQYSEAIELLKIKINEHPNNTDIHNLARAYLKINNYDTALNYINSALFLSKDEIGYYLKGEILYHLKIYEDALTYYIKAMRFLNNENKIHRFKDADGQNTNSVNTDPETKKVIYVGLANCYIALGEFVKAKSITESIKKEWPFDDELARLEQNIEILLNQRISMDEVKEETIRLKEMLSEQEFQYEKNIQELKGWALEIFRLQNEYMDRENTIDEDDWQAVMQEMHDIALNMKNEKSQSVDYNQVKSTLQNKFVGISETGLEFLATGEYLFDVNKTKEIDFAPVMVEFSKVIETELNRCLSCKGLIDSKNPLTLGNLRWMLDKLKISSLHSYQSNLEKLVNFRNGSAHTGQSTREKVEIARDLIMNTGWLEDILKLNDKK